MCSNCHDLLCFAGRVGKAGEFNCPSKASSLPDKKFQQSSTSSSSSGMMPGRCSTRKPFKVLQVFLLQVNPEPSDQTLNPRLSPRALGFRP